MSEQTNGPEVHLSRGPDAGVECNTLAPLIPAVPFDQRAEVTCTRCLHTVLALTEDDCDRWRQRAKQAEAILDDVRATWERVHEEQSARIRDEVEHSRALDAELDELRARVAELEAAQRWRNTMDELPAYGVKVEGFDEVDGQFIGRFGLRGWRAEHGAMSAYRTFGRVTHWRPLLPDPTASEWRPLPDGPEAAT